MLISGYTQGKKDLGEKSIEIINFSGVVNGANAPQIMDNE